MDHFFLTQEGFIRRAAMINAHFMLKGSFLTRQYLLDPKIRKANDLDWLYLGEHLTDADKAGQLFDKWVDDVINFPINDDVKIKVDKETNYWCQIDYAMNEDFPTVNKYLVAEINRESIEFTIDLSFNLDVELPPVAMMYQPANGEPFYLPKSASPSNQIAWKLHQSIVRLRLKDLFDLYFLLQNPLFDREILSQALQLYVNECFADKKDINRIQFIIDGKWEKLLDVFELTKYKNSELLKFTWNYWRYNESVDYQRSSSMKIYEKSFDYSSFDEISDYPEIIPTDLNSFINHFVEVCRSSGLTELSRHLPKPREIKRTSMDTKFKLF